MNSQISKRCAMPIVVLLIFVGMTSVDGKKHYKVEEKVKNDHPMVKANAQWQK